jgi:hypothetical protein
MDIMDAETFLFVLAVCLLALCVAVPISVLDREYSRLFGADKDAIRDQVKMAKRKHVHNKRDYN